MALFKSRKGGDEQPAPPPQPESVEAMRKRARHRLIGAALLVLAGVIGFPLLFDTQPRPIAVDIPIEIPDKNKTRPISIAASPAIPPPAPAAQSAVAQAGPANTPKAPEAAKEAAVAPKSEEKQAAAPVSTAQIATKKEANSDPKETRESGDGAKAQALLDGSPAHKTAPITEGRFVVQVGAFADATRAKEARTKIERAGMKTYTQVVETKDGQRTRVRVGPFTDKNDADKVASKIKALDLPAAILVL